MTGAPPHNRITARAAREILRPMGLTQKRHVALEARGCPHRLLRPEPPDRGLAGDAVEAARHFRCVAESDDDRDWWRPIKAIAARLEEAEPAAVKQEAIAWIESYCRSLGLPPFDPSSLSRE